MTYWDFLGSGYFGHFILVILFRPTLPWLQSSNNDFLKIPVHSNHYISHGETQDGYFGDPSAVKRSFQNLT